MNAPLPLFRHYPQLQSRLPWTPLAELPTAVHALPGLADGWIKRDDQSRSDYGGNKVRKLEFVLAEMQQRGVRQAYTFGAIGTNAGVAAALLCRQAGIGLTIYTFDQPDSATVRSNQLLMHRLGVHLAPMGSLARAVRRFYLHPARWRRDSYFLFAGCSNPVGVFGYINAAFELAEQIAAGRLPEPARIVLPVGSNGTLAGLTLGCDLAGLRSEVVGIRVAASHLGPIATCTAGAVQQMMAGAARSLRQAVPALRHWRPRTPILRDDWFGAGYGVASAAGQAAVARFAADWAIPLEGTYSGKAAAAFLQLAGDGRPSLFWNTFNSQPTAQRLAEDGVA